MFWLKYLQKKKKNGIIFSYILNYNYMGVTPNVYWDHHSSHDSYDKIEKEDANLKAYERYKQLNNPEFKKWQKAQNEPTEYVEPNYDWKNRLKWGYKTSVDINNADLEAKAILERERKKQAWIRDQLSNSELARTSDPVVTTESGSQDSADLPKHSVDENLSSQETRSDQIVSKKKMELSKKLLWPKKYSIFISFLKEQYPDDKLTNTKIIQKVTDLQKEYNTSHTDKPLIPDGVMWSKTYNAIISPSIDF